MGRQDKPTTGKINLAPIMVKADTLDQRRQGQIKNQTKVIDHLKEQLFQERARAEVLQMAVAAMLREAPGLSVVLSKEIIGQMMAEGTSVEAIERTDGGVVIRLAEKENSSE